MQTRRNIRVDCVEFDAAQSRWEVIETSGLATPFQSFGWVSTLARTLGRSTSADILVLIAHDLASGRDLMLLPLVRRAFGPMRVFEIPDFGVSDYCAPIVAAEVLAEPERLAAVWKMVLKAVPGGDMVRVSKIPGSMTQPMRTLLEAGQSWQMQMQSWQVDLPERWLDYEAGILSRNARSLLHRGLRKLEATGPVTRVDASDELAVDAIFAVLCAQREARFANLGRRNVLRDAAVREFYLQIVKRGLTSGLASLSALKRGPDIVATILGLTWRDTYLILVPTMTTADALQRCRVGKLMIWLQMQAMHTRGCRRIDFTIGNEPYKRNFGAVPRLLHEVALPREFHGYPLAWSLKIKAGLNRWRQMAALAK